MLLRRAVFALPLIACAGVEPPPAAGPWSSGPELGAAPLEVNPELTDVRRAPLVLTVDEVAPGGVATLTVTGASAFEIVHIGRSLAGLGPGPCLGTQGLLCLDINAPVVEHASFATDASGAGVLVQNVPPAVPIGLDLWLQAVVPRGASGFSWIKSAPVQVTTTNPPLTVGSMGPGDLVITEVLPNPLAVADAAGEWFEVRNASGQDANLVGLRITNGVDVDPITSNLFLAAGARAVFGVDADPATNGGVAVDWDYGTMELADVWGEIYLLAGATLIDGVAWDDGSTYPGIEGVSASLASGLDHLDNDIATSWCAGTTPFGDGDLGTPGAPNGPCGSVSQHDDFDTGAVDPGVFAPLVGDAVVQSDYSSSGLYALRLGGNGGTARTLPIDTASCPSVVWSYMGKRGPESPENGDKLELSFADPGGWWISADEWFGAGVSDPAFALRSGTITSPSALHAGFMVKLQSFGTSGNYDHFYVDDFDLRCGP